MDSASPANATWVPTLRGSWLRPGPGYYNAGCSVVSQLGACRHRCSCLLHASAHALTHPRSPELDPSAVSLYGGMAELWLNITLDATDVQTNGGAHCAVRAAGRGRGGEGLGALWSCRREEEEGGGAKA